MINLQICGSLFDVQSQNIVGRRMFLPRLETVRTEFLLPGVLHEAIALCGHCCLTHSDSESPVTSSPWK